MVMKCLEDQPVSYSISSKCCTLRTLRLVVSDDQLGPLDIHTAALMDPFCSVFRFGLGI